MSQILDELQDFKPSFRQVDAHPRRYLDTLLSSIRDGLVIPIIGPELLEVKDENGQPVLLYDYVARRLAGRLELTEHVEKEYPDGYSLQDVISEYSKIARTLDDIYPEIKSIVEDGHFTTPPALLKLAGISGFRLFVTTTFDSLLVQAVNEVRFEKQASTRQVVYAGNRIGGDLKKGWDADGEPPVVFHLLGLATTRERLPYVVTEEDTLEFIWHLQEDAEKMHLFEELQTKQLLLLGCSFPDWLARFFIRMAKRTRLSAGTPRLLLADRRSPGDRNLAVFLDNFSSSTRVFPRPATDFVDLLAEQWKSKYGDAPAPPARVPADTGAGADQKMVTGSVLISYASEDREAALRLRTALEGVTDVWLDRDDLIPGNLWASHIERAIKDCELFVPLLSRRAAARREGYFRNEWYQAISRSQNRDSQLPFIVPVVIDDLEVNSAGIPQEFWTRHAARLPDVEETDAFVAVMKELVRQVRNPPAGQR